MVGKVTAVDSCLIFTRFNADVINPLIHEEWPCPKFQKWICLESLVCHEFFSCMWLDHSMCLVFESLSALQFFLC